MSYDIWETIASTPWYIYFFFGFIIYRISLTTRPQSIPPKNFFFLSLFIVYASINYIFTLKLALYSSLLLLAAGLVAGLPAGWLQYRLLKVRLLKEEKKIYIPGSWLMFIWNLAVLCAILSLFTVSGIDNQAFMQGQGSEKFLLIYGGLAGIFFGKLLYTRRCRKDAV